MTFDLHKDHHHSQLASALILTKYGSHSTYFAPFDLHQGHHSQLASALLLTKYGSHNTYFTQFDHWWPLTSIKVIIILSLHQGFFWPNMVAIAHSSPHLTSDDLWPPSRSPCAPSALALPTYQISSRWGIRFSRNAPDKFLHKLCKLGT